MSEQMGAVLAVLTELFVKTERMSFPNGSNYTKRTPCGYETTRHIEVNRAGISRAGFVREGDEHIGDGPIATASSWGPMGYKSTTTSGFRWIEMDDGERFVVIPVPQGRGPGVDLGVHFYSRSDNPVAFELREL